MRQIIILITLVGLIITGALSDRIKLSEFKSATDDKTLVFPDEIPAEPRGYRMDQYRSPVPKTLRGVQVVNNLIAKQIFDKGDVIFIDVMPYSPKPPNLSKGTIWRDEKRFNIPNSIWLANVGFGRLAPEMDVFFRAQLALISQDDYSKALLFYCLKDCWMSWNAAKRARSYGYFQVYWYPEGSDGWQAIGGRLSEAKPIPLPDMTRPIN